MKNNRLIILPLLVALVSSVTAIGFQPRPYTRRPFTSASQYRNLNMELQRAAGAGDVAGVKAVLSKGADINYQDANGDTAAHMAARGGHEAVLVALRDARPCPNLSIRNNAGQTPAAIPGISGPVRSAASQSSYWLNMCESWETANPPR